MTGKNLEDELRRLGEGKPSDNLMTYLNNKASKVEQEALESARKLNEMRKSDKIERLASMRLDRGDLVGTIELIPEINDGYYKADIYIKISSKYIDLEDYTEAIKTLEKAHDAIENMKEGNEDNQTMQYIQLLRFYHNVLCKLKEMKEEKSEE